MTTTAPDLGGAMAELSAAGEIAAEALATAALVGALAAILDRIDVGELTASTALRYRLEGAAAALDAVLGRRPDLLGDLAGEDTDTRLMPPITQLRYVQAEAIPVPRTRMRLEPRWRPRRGAGPRSLLRSARWSPNWRLPPMRPPLNGRPPSLAGQGPWPS